MKRRSKAGLGDSTLAVHAGERNAAIGDSVAFPVFQTATFAFEDSAKVRTYQEETIKTRAEYGRYGNPTQAALERKLATLHGTEDGVVTSSGMSAIVDALLAHCSQGDRLVVISECYSGTRLFCENELPRFGVKVVFAASNTEALVRAATKGTRLLLVEAPTNPHLLVPDLPVLAKVCRRNGVILAVDSTMAGPFNLDPVALGADLVLLSLTKYIAGHNDVIGGAALGSRKLVEPIRKMHGMTGTLLAPAAVQLVTRGLKTLSLRMKRHNENGEAIARYLEKHAKVEAVFYPSLATHPDRETARRLMKGFGGVVTFRVKGGLKDAERVVDRLKIFQIAPSLGGAESLAECVTTMAYWNRTRAQRKKLGIPDNLIRLAAGLEDAEDLIADLDQALR